MQKASSSLSVPHFVTQPHTHTHTPTMYLCITCRQTFFNAITVDALARADKNTDCDTASCLSPHPPPLHHPHHPPPPSPHWKWIWTTIHTGLYNLYTPSSTSLAQVPAHSLLWQTTLFFCSPPWQAVRWRKSSRPIVTPPPPNCKHGGVTLLTVILWWMLHLQNETKQQLSWLLWGRQKCYQQKWKELNWMNWQGRNGLDCKGTKIRMP